MSSFLESFGFKSGHSIYLLIFAILVIVSTTFVSVLNTNDFILEDKSTGIYILNIETLEELRDQLNNAQIGHNFYFITNDKDYLEPFEFAASNIDSIYLKLKHVNNEHSLTLKYLDSLSVLVKKRFALFNTCIAIQDKSKRKEESKISKMMDEGNVLQEEINSLIARIKKEEKNQWGLRIELVNTKAKFALVILLLGSILGILLFTLSNRVKNLQTNEVDPHSHLMTREELDKLVRERTSEISVTNLRLNQEIDRHKLTEQALKKTTHEYRLLFEQAHDAIIIFDIDNITIMDVNSRACEIYGIEKQYFIGISVIKMCKNPLQEKENINNTIVKEDYLGYQSVHYRGNGTEMLVEINASVINFRGKRAILSINRDITDRVLSIRL